MGCMSCRGLLSTHQRNSEPQRIAAVDESDNEKRRRIPAATNLNSRAGTGSTEVCRPRAIHPAGLVIAA